ncbi:Bromodomain containing protein [Gracilaria domingensis]|nr:Bromodomain containing protein [Gracilaria domingensis]
MTSVHEDVIKDVQQTAVSEAAGELRKALRLAFENIIDPPKEQSEPMSQPSAPSPVQTQPSRQEVPQETKISFLPTIKQPNAKQENKAEALKQIRPLECLASRANTNSVQQSERPQTSVTDNEIEVPQPTARQKTSPKYNTPPSMQTIPTDLFQTAHNILELKAKEEAAKASLAAKENRKDEPNQTNSVQEHSSSEHNDAHTPRSHDRLTSKSSGDHERATSKGVDPRNPHHQEGGEILAVEQVDDTKRDSDIDPKPMQSPETFAAYDSGRKAKVAEIPRKSQIEAKKLNSISDGETMDVEALHDNNATAPTTEQRRGRKRRKPTAKLVVDGVGTRKRRRKSKLQHDARTEVEEGGRDKRKRGRKDAASTPSKRPRKIRRQNDAVANMESERVTEKRSGRKRGKSSEKGIDPAVAALIDPQNPNRPRSYEVLEPTCIPEDYERQTRVLQVLENLLEHEYSSLFAEPVDLGDEGQSSYLREIKNPMDLGTIANRLKKGTPQQSFFENVNEVLADIELVWWNCAHFNAQYDPVVQDMYRCKEELSVLLQCLALNEENPKTLQERSEIRENTNAAHNGAREEIPEGDEVASDTNQKQRANSSIKDPSDLNNGQLLGKEGAIFRYVGQRKASKRKAWCLCTVTGYDETSRSYTLLWEDKSETRNATIGVGSMFNIHRFRKE